jgi:hypothetical protein
MSIVVIKDAKVVHEGAVNSIPHFKNDFIVTTVFCSLTSVFALYVLTRALRIKERSFFITILGLVIVAMVSLSLALYLMLECAI